METNGRKLVQGIGVNDADYIVYPSINGKQTMCPYYQSWKNMLVRCYSPILHAKKPTYVDCSVAPDWHGFMSFRSWMIKQEWKGLHLDKDIKVRGNKIYSPELCLFVPQPLNKLLNNHAAGRGDYPVGVCFDKPTQQFRVHLSDDGKIKYLGLFDTPEEASEVYQQARKEKIEKLIVENTYPVATEYLQQHIRGEKLQ